MCSDLLRRIQSGCGPLRHLVRCTATSVVRCRATARQGGSDHADEQALAYDEARRIGVNIATLPKFC